MDVLVASPNSNGRAPGWVCAGERMSHWEMSAPSYEPMSSFIFFIVVPYFSARTLLSLPEARGSSCIFPLPLFLFHQGYADDWDSLGNSTWVKPRPIILITRSTLAASGAAPFDLVGRSLNWSRPSESTQNGAAYNYMLINRSGKQTTTAGWFFPMSKLHGDKNSLEIGGSCV